MANKLMTFETIRSVRKHPNADKLDIVNVAGYEAIVGRDVYKVGDSCFFVHPDASLPKEQEWAQEFLSFVSPNTRRVKAKNIRGEWSFGLVVPVNKTTLSIIKHNGYEGRDYFFQMAGREVSESFGVTKYEAPLPVDLSVKGPLPFCLRPTDEDRWQNFNPELILDQECTITEKIDGTSLTVYCVLPGHCGNETEDPIMGYCMRNNELKIPSAEEPTTNRYWKACQKSGVFDKLRDYCAKTGMSLAIRGEVYGLGIQTSKNNLWSTVENDVRWFSLMNIQTLEYLPFTVLMELCINSGPSMKTVPVIYVGEKLTKELITRLETAKTLEEENREISFESYELWNDEFRHGSTMTGRVDMFEGVVCQYVDKQTGKVRSFKIMNKPYDEAK